MKSSTSGRSPAPAFDAATTERLFRASCVALVAPAMSFALRGDILGDFEPLFAVSKTAVGSLPGPAFWGFGFAIRLVGPPFAPPRLGP